MTTSALILLLLTVILTIANGANDVSKGVATLAGSGVARARRAILFGHLALRFPDCGIRKQPFLDIA